MKNHIKSLRLFILPVFVLALIAAVGWWKQQHPRDIKVTIGPFTNDAARERAALESLSQQMSAKPLTQVYWIYDKSLPAPSTVLFFKRLPDSQNRGRRIGILWLNTAQSAKTRKLLKDFPYFQQFTEESLHIAAQKQFDFPAIVQTYPLPAPRIPAN